MNGNYVINAHFKTIPIRTLTIISGFHGSVTQPGVGTYSYNDGTIVDLQAVANSGHTFVNWIGNVDGVANKNSAGTTVTMKGNYVIMANFSP
jgi:hypothetical protein